MTTPTDPGPPSVIGTVGARPDALAQALADRGVARAPTVHRAVIALDLTADVGAEEIDLLNTCAAARTPTALVATGVDDLPDWPDAMARARAVLDPKRRLALFAVSTSTGGGVDDLAAWCAEVGSDQSVPTPVPTGSPTPVTRLVAPDRAGGDAPLRELEAGPTRTARLTGLRAGLAAARTEALAAVRESAQSLAVTADRACGTLRRGGAEAYAAWLLGRLESVEATAAAALEDRLDHVRGTATVGLGAGGWTPPTVDGTGRRAAGPPPRRPAGGDDALILLFGVTAGFGAGRMLVAPAVQWLLRDASTAGWLPTVVTACAGLAIAAWVVSVRRTAADRAALRRWTADSIGLSRTVLENRLAGEITAVEAHVGREIWNRTRPRRV